jgi:hypothetical protein
MIDNNGIFLKLNTFSGKYFKSIFEFINSQVREKENSEYFFKPTINGRANGIISNE